MITVPLAFVSPPLTQNQVRRMHYQAEAKLKRTIIAATITSIRRAKVEPVTEPVHVTLNYRPGTRRRFDADGLAPTLKTVLDALVRSNGTNPGVLTDDDWTHVPAVTIRVHEPQPGATGSMWLTITPEIQEN